MTVNTTSLALAQVMHELLRLDDNMPVVQALIFLHVSAATDNNGGPSGDEIAEALQIDKTRVSRNLKSLQSRNMIVRTRREFRPSEKAAVLSPLGTAFLEKLERLLEVKFAMGTNHP